MKRDNGLPHWPTFTRAWWTWKPWLGEPLAPYRWEYVCSCGGSASQGLTKRYVKRVARAHQDLVGMSA